MLPAEVSAQRVGADIGVDETWYVAVDPVRPGVGERAVRRHKTVVVALTRGSQADRPGIAGCQDELQSAGDRFAPIDLLPRRQIGHKPLAIVVKAAQAQADLLGKRPAAV